MPMYGKGDCLYEFLDECRLGDKGIEVNPIYCLNCVLLYLAEVIKDATTFFPEKEEEDEKIESRLR